ncbi:MYND-type domain-containing protein [Mycena kentingensis (nom. inval.)]|nr:MYND-type domain-containing protein [Mycena kentingensis (nom. inval.)]
MHPSLQPSNLQKLSLITRKKALAVADASISSSELAAFAENTKNLPKRDLPFLSAAYWAILDPARMPSVGRLDTFFTLIEYTDLIHRTLSVFIALRCLGALHAVPREAAAELWSRIWPWMDLVTGLHDLVEVSLDVSPAELHDQLVRLVSMLYGGAGAARGDGMGFFAFTELPNARICLARSWRALVEADCANPGLRPELLNLSQILGTIDFRTLGDGVLDLVDGAGGTWDGLAQVVVAHLHHVTLNGSDRLAARCMAAVHGLSESTFIREPAFATALLRTTYIQDLVRACGAIQRGRALGTEDFQILCVLYLSVLKTFQHSPRRVHLVAALGAGFLSDLFELTSRRFRSSKMLKDLFLEFLETDLRASLAFRSILESITAATVADLRRRIDEGHVFAHPEARPVWERFLVLAEQRLAFIDDISRSIRRCQNLECLRLAQVDSLNVCGGCRESYYCSPVCQKADWSSGHRQLCGVSTTSAPHETASRRDKRFLARVLHADFIRRSGGIAYQLFRYYYTHGADGQAPALKLDYRFTEKDARYPQVGTMRPEPDTPWTPFLQYAEKLRRAGNGRVLVLIYTVNEGTPTQVFWRAYLHRMATSRYDDGLRELARRWRGQVRDAESRGQTMEFKPMADLRSFMDTLDGKDFGV